MITGLEAGGGAEAMLAKTLPYLEKTENAVCSLKGKGDIGRFLEEKGIKVYQLDIKGVWDLGAIGRYKKVVQEFKPDIQVNYLIHADVFGRLFAKKAGVPYLVSYIRNRHIKPLFVFLERMTIGRIDHLLCNSRSVLEHYRYKYKIPERSSSAILNGVRIGEEPEMDISRYKEELGVDKEEKVITCIASLTSQKDQATLLRAVRVLKDEQKSGFKVLLAGDGPEKERLHSLAKDLCLEDKVIFLGKRRDVDKLLAVSDIFVLPSLHEGMSNALLEAMSAGVVSIVSSIGENRELIKHNVSGLVFNVGDPESLAQNISRALSDPEKMSKFADKAKETIRQDHDIEKIKKELDDFLSRI